jgi:hypothetical protein
VDNPKNPPYLSRILSLAPVDKNVDNPRFPVDRLWISGELSTGWSYPQFYPQVYPQFLPLLSTGLSTGRPRVGRHIRPTFPLRGRLYPQATGVIHRNCGKVRRLVETFRAVIHRFSSACGWVVEKTCIQRLFCVTNSWPWGRGVRITFCSSPVG